MNTTHHSRVQVGHVQHRFKRLTAHVVETVVTWRDDGAQHVG